MKALNLSSSLLLCGVLFAAGSGCVVEFPDELPYTCQEDADCGGNGYLCAQLPDARRYCCLPEPELCNRVDDDCDGLVDNLEADPCYSGPEETRNVGACRAGKPTCGEGGNILCVGEVLPTQETCNGKDDDCDGSVDEDFDFQTGRDNCGRCDQICTELQDCAGGQCVRRRETACDNTVDDDTDTLTDCADPDCNGLPCGAGCVCLAGKQSEAECGNSADDEGDGPTDCADPDCDDKPCGEGCLCIGGVRGEGQCGNDLDDEGDGPKDCADPDCNEKTCGVGCVCRASSKAEDLCDDNEDNDGDGKTDCEDSDCANLECGLGCQCQSLAKAEVGCSDGLDNDGDGLIDCADPHCNNQSCVFGEPGAVCLRRQCAEIRCENTLDDDKDGVTDCQDPDCEGVLLNASPTGRLCTVANGPQEGGGNACTDGNDNDGDQRTDCRNNGNNQPEPNCLSGICGVGCQYNNAPGSACNVKLETRCDDGLSNDGDAQVDCADADCDGRSCSFLLQGCVCASLVKKEAICDDGLDNDGNNGADCSDQADCPQGTVCRKGDGSPGTCNGSRQCT